MVLWLIKKALYSKKFSKTDPGTSYALYQIIKYIIWVITIGIILEAIAFGGILIIILYKMTQAGGLIDTLPIINREKS